MAINWAKLPSCAIFCLRANLANEQKMRKRRDVRKNYKNCVTAVVKIMSQYSIPLLYSAFFFSSTLIYSHLPANFRKRIRKTRNCIRKRSDETKDKFQRSPIIFKTKLPSFLDNLRNHYFSYTTCLKIEFSEYLRDFSWYKFYFQTLKIINNVQ